MRQYVAFLPISALFHLADTVSSGGHRVLVSLKISQQLATNAAISDSKPTRPCSPAIPRCHDLHVPRPDHESSQSTRSFADKSTMDNQAVRPG